MTDTTESRSKAADAGQTKRLAAVAIPAGVLLLGFLWVFQQSLLGPGRWIPGDSGDTALVHYFLEHGNQWLHGADAGRSFWDAPFFYPHPNSMAYSEVLLGLLPFYAVWRVLGAGFGGAYQLWFASLAILNFVIMYLFLRKVIVVRELPSALGAYLFAFGSSRLNQIAHSQLWAEFYVVLAVWFLIRFLQLKTSEPRGRAVLWLSLAGAATALQLISGFYFGWFLCFTLLVGLVLGLVQGHTRRELLQRARRFWPALAVAAAVFLGLSGSCLVHYRAAATELKASDFGARGLIMPTLGSWIYAGDRSLLYGWMRHIPQVSRLDYFWERANGIGVITGILVLAGAILWRRRPIIRIMLWITAIILVITFTIPGGWTLWTYVAAPIPGATAIRAVTRWGLFLLFPFAVGLACCLDEVYGRRGWAEVALLGLMVMLEQAVQIQHYDFRAFEHEARQYASQLKSACGDFLISGPSGGPRPGVYMQVISMWTQIFSGIPTLNGYSGGQPPGYVFSTPLDNVRNYVILREGIERWERQYPAAGSRTCWLRPTPVPLLAPEAPVSLEVVSPGSIQDNFIRWSYLGILGRLPLPGELASGEKSLDAARQSRADWILALMQTPEGRQRAFVEETYLAVLGRDADLGGWLNWSAALANGSVTSEHLVEQFLNSPEYRQRCELRKSCRPASDAANLTRQIESLESDPEQENRVDAELIFLCLLGRPTGPEMVSDWTHRFDTGTPKSSYVEMIIHAPEYHHILGDQP